MDTVGGLTPEAGRGSARARMRQLLIEAGIAPDDPLAPPFDELAGAVEELRQIATTARQPVRDQELRSAVVTGIRSCAPDILRAFNWRTALYIAGAVLLLAGALVSGGMFAYAQGHAAGYAEANARLVTAPQLSGALAAPDATAWVRLIENNPTVGDTRRDCAVQNGRRACYFALWIDAAGPAPVLNEPSLVGDPPARPHKP